MAGCSQAILGPFLGVIQNMYLDDTHKGRGVFCEVRLINVPNITQMSDALLIARAYASFTPSWGAEAFALLTKEAIAMRCGHLHKRVGS
jgi:hypothetical protein